MTWALLGQSPPVRRALRVKGLVQGVGFRPFVWRLARELAGQAGQVAQPALRCNLAAALYLGLRLGRQLALQCDGLLLHLLQCLLQLLLLGLEFLQLLHQRMLLL